MPPPPGGIRSTYSLEWPATSAANTRLSLDHPAARFAAFSSDTAASPPNRWPNHASSRALVSAKSRWMSAIPAMPPRFTYAGSDVNDRSFTFGAWDVIRSRGEFAAAVDLRSDRGHVVAAGRACPWLSGYAVHLAPPRARFGAPRLSGGGSVAARIRRAERPTNQRRYLRSPPARRTSPLRRGRPRAARRPRLGSASRIRRRRHRTGSI